MVKLQPQYIAAGGNRHPDVADWDSRSGLLAYGAENNVALWEPLVVHLSLFSSRYAHLLDRMRATRVCKLCCEAIPVESTLSNSYYRHGVAKL